MVATLSIYMNVFDEENLYPEVPSDNEAEKGEEEQEYFETLEGETSEEEERHVPPIDSSALMSSHARSMNEYDRVLRDVEGIHAEEPEEEGAMPAKREADSEPEAESDPEAAKADPKPEAIPEDARIIGRPRKMPRLAGPPAEGAWSRGVSRPATQQPPPGQPDPSPQSSGPQDKGKAQEVLFEVPLHERPLATEEADAIKNLTPAQTRHLVERFRAEITAESLPGHRAELSHTRKDMQTMFDRKLAAEQARWEEEKRGAVALWEEERRRTKMRTDRMANERGASVDSLKEKLKTMEQELRASFSRGEEQGRNSAAADNAARWFNTGEQMLHREAELRTREQQLEQERTRLEGLSGDQINVSKADVAAQAERTAILAQEYLNLRRERATEVEDLNRKLRKKDEEMKQVRDEAVSNARGLEQQLAAKNESTTRLENRLNSERLSHQQAMRDRVMEHERRERALLRSWSEEVEQLRTEHERKQHHPSEIPMEVDDDISRLSDMMSSLHVQEGMHGRNVAVPANSASIPPPASSPPASPPPANPPPANSAQINGQDGQAPTVRQPSMKRLRQNLAREKARKETLRNSLAQCRAKQNQPPVDHCATRLQNLRARLDHKHRRELDEQAAGMKENFRKEAEAFQTDRDEDLVKASGTIAGLEKELKASRAEVKRQREAFQEAEESFRSLEDRKMKLWEENRQLSRTKRQLEVSLRQWMESQQCWLREERALRASLNRSKRTVEDVREELGETTRAKDAAEADARSLRIVYATLETEKQKLTTKLRARTAKLQIASADLDRCGQRSNNLAGELDRVRGRLAASEATIRGWEEGTRQAAAPPPEMAVVKEAEEGERELDAPLGLPERARWGSFRPQFPRWKDFVDCMLMLLFLGLLVAALFAASADNRRRQR